MSHSIRPYKPADRAKLIEVFMLNVPKHFDPKEVNDLEGYLDKLPETYYTIEVDGTIVGGVGCVVEQDLSGSITWIFMHPNYAGQGLGRAAVEHCLSILKNDERVNVFKARTSQTAYRFFEKMGFQVKAIQKDYWAEGLDLYVVEMGR